MVSVNIKKTSTKYYTATFLDVGSHKKTQKGVPGLIVTTFFLQMKMPKAASLNFFKNLRLKKTPFKFWYTPNALRNKMHMHDGDIREFVPDFFKKMYEWVWGRSKNMLIFIEI